MDIFQSGFFVQISYLVDEIAKTLGNFQNFIFFKFKKKIMLEKHQVKKLFRA
jgi:hypothetical protein